MKNLTYITTCIILFVVAFTAGCGDRPLLTEMGTNRLMVVLKGTYESNSPMPWSMPVPTDLDYETLVLDDSVDDCDVAGPNPSFLMMDIAELKLVDSKGKNYRFANYRQTLAFPFSDLEPFFSGLGVVLENDDVPSRKEPYVAIGLYLRKMLMDSAIRFYPGADGWQPQYEWDSFDSQEFPSFNFNQFQIHSFYDTLRYEKAYINRVYPLTIPITDLNTGNLGFIYNKEPPLTVLEIRMVVKNFVKKYEYGSYPDQVHYFALSDWLQNVEPDETSIGGNIITAVRSYVPGMTGAIRGSNTGGDRHIIAIPAGADIRLYTLNTDPYGTSIGDNVRSNNPCNVPWDPGLYFGPNIAEALDKYMLIEMNKVKWNDLVPGACNSFDSYIANWDIFSGEVNGSFKLPPLAVYALGSSEFSIDNVAPGQYDLYRAIPAAEYGRLYEDGEFEAYPDNPITVGIGTATDRNGLDYMVF